MPYVTTITNAREIAEQLATWLEADEEIEEPLADRRRQAAIERAEERYKER